MGEAVVLSHGTRVPKSVVIWARVVSRALREYYVLDRAALSLLVASYSFPVREGIRPKPRFTSAPSRRPRSSRWGRAWCRRAKGVTVF